jgi:AraC-like DNA-binding protein
LTDTTLPVFAIDHTQMTREANLAAWREATQTLFDIHLDEPALEAAFFADLCAYAMGPILFGSTTSSPQRFVRSATTIARSGVDHILVQLYRQGSYHGLAGDRPIAVQAGDICVLDCAETLETRATAFENLSMVVPRGMIEPSVANPGSLHGLVLPGDGALGQLLARHLSALYALAPQLSFDECEHVVTGTVALIIACLRGELEARDDVTSSAHSVSLIKIRRHIDNNLTSASLDVDGLAERFALSRASLYRLFEPLGGVASYVRRKRLHRAFFEITTPRLKARKISEVARRFQFSNEGSFTRAFKAAYGITPRAARQAASLTRPEFFSAAEGSKDALLTRWIKDIVPSQGP